MLAFHFADRIIGLLGRLIDGVIPELHGGEDVGCACDSDDAGVERSTGGLEEKWLEELEKNEVR